MNQYSWSALQVGQKASFKVLLTAEMVDVFAQICGDSNPFHLDEGFARALGFRGRVAHGMLTASLYSRLIGIHLPGKYAFLHGIDIDFSAPAYIGDCLTVGGEIVFLSEAYRRIEMKARIVNQEAKIISKAAIRAGLHES